MRWLIASVTALVVLGAFAVNASGLQPGPATIRVSDRVVLERILAPGLRKITTSLTNPAYPNSIAGSTLLCRKIGEERGPMPPEGQFCEGVYRFLHGQLVVEGYMGSRSFYTLAVVGGTGEYSNSGAGQMAAVTLGLNPREQQLTFTLYST
jgi:hypothetical protein